MNAKDFYTLKNGGKTPEESVEHGEYINALWCAELMEEYAALREGSRIKYIEYLQRKIDIWAWAYMDYDTWLKKQNEEPVCADKGQGR